MLRKPYVLFLGDVEDNLAAKVAFGINDWRGSDCVGQIRLDGCKASIDLPQISIFEAKEKGAKTLIVGVANRGGGISKSWHASLIEAANMGLDIASGLHELLDTVPGLEEAAKKNNAVLYEARIPKGPFPIASAQPRSGHRLLTVGTDCSVGKMYTALAIERELKRRGVKADFRATGQTGILITGSGVPIDAVVADFISGAIEQLCPSNEKDHWDIIEGQGSLFHPSFAGVSLGLIHGAQPTDLVLCHEPTRTHMRGLPDVSLPGIMECIDSNLNAAHLVNSRVKFRGIAINSSEVEEDQRQYLFEELQKETGLIVFDPLKTSIEKFVSNLLEKNQ